jgi:Acyltransferase family
MLNQTSRNGALDAIKTWMTILVVFHHTAISYGASGGWFYKEILPSQSLSSLLLVYFCTVNQAYFMGLFFLIAGYFSYPSLVRKGAGQFVRDRLIRLGLPLIFFGFVLGPITLALAQTAKEKSFIDVLTRLWQDGVFEQGPLWFAKALLLFSAALLLIHSSLPLTKLSFTRIPSHKTLLFWAIVSGTAAFLVRLAYPVGSEFWGLQLGYFPMYVLLFASGCLAAKGQWLERIPSGTAKTWRHVAYGALPCIIPLGLLSSAWPIFSGSPLGGWSLPALIYALWEPFVAWGALFGLLHYAQQTQSKPTALMQKTARSAFTVFVIHPIVVVGVAILLRSFQAPALFKFFIVGTLSTVICFVLAAWILKLPGLKRVL